MPYGYQNRGYSGKNRGNYRRNYAKAAMPYLNAGQKALQIAVATQKLLNVEYKFLAQGVSGTASSTPTVQCITCMAQGATDQTRNGNKIKLVSMRVQGKLTQHETATQSGMRMVIVRDNMGSTTPPVIGDIWDSAADFDNNRPRSPSAQKMARFTLLMSQFWMLNDNGQQQGVIDYYKKIGSHVTFTGPNATDEGKGSLWLIVGSNEATNTVAIFADVIVRYIDN